jgi:hypothetical protein
VNSWQKTFSTEEKLVVIAYLIKVNELLTYVIMLGSFIVVVMLIESKKVLREELTCLFV